MKLQNVKVGTRVVLKEMCSHLSLMVGTQGTIMEALDTHPRIKWDNFTEGTNGLYGEMSNHADIWAVSIKKLKHIK